MHHEVHLQHVVHHNSHQYLIDIAVGMKGITRMIGDTQTTGIITDPR